MKIQQIEDFQPIAETLIQGNQIISGFLPEFLNETVRDAIARGELEDALTYYCNGLSNQVSLRLGDGLLIVPEVPTLDSDDSEADLSDLLTKRALKPTQAAINDWVKTLTNQLNAWKAEGLTLVEIRDRIPQLYGSLGSDAFAKTLHQAMQVSYLGARSEVLEEIEGNASENDS